MHSDIPSCSVIPGVSISATLRSSTKSATLYFRLPGPSYIQVKPSTVTGGSTATDIVVFDGPTPAGGIVVNLTLICEWEGGRIVRGFRDAQKMGGWTDYLSVPLWRA